VRKLVVLMIEVEQPEGLSARKLVLETAKHNVLTAYSGESGLELFARFPRVDAVVIHAHVTDLSCSEIAMKIKLFNPSMPIIILNPSPSGEVCQTADYVVDSLVPNDILEVLANKLGADVSNP
jgi:response regulator RpfG family c-di-GMP phosphodiesterase